MIVSIHQPEHLPWLGFFDKVRQSDVFVLLDNVQYEKNYFQNRNRIRTQSGWIWLTVPVLTKGKSNQLINDVNIVNTGNWQDKHWKSIFYAYNKAPYFDNHRPFLEEIYNKKKWDYLVDLNETIILYLIQKLGIQVNILRSSTLGVEGKSTDLLLNICMKLNATAYLSGISGKDYLEEEKFIKENIKVIYQEFHHPIYEQLYETFIPCMSVIDLLFNYGEKSLDIIRGVGVEKMEEPFK